MSTPFNSAQDAREFVLAGNATVTLQSRKSGNHFTYRVRQATDRSTGEPVNRWFVSLMNGPDNESSYAYIGLLDADAHSSGMIQFRQTAKCRAGADAPSVCGFVFFWRAVVDGRMPADMIVRHEGRCGRCNRKLTVPESIDRGIGPECATRVGVAA